MRRLLNSSVCRSSCINRRVGDPANSWKRWWADRPRRPQSRMPAGMSENERDKWITERERIYYATHKSARIARKAAILGVIEIIVGWYLTFSVNNVRVGVGWGLIVLGVLVIIVSVYFFSSITRS